MLQALTLTSVGIAVLAMLPVEQGSMQFGEQISQQLATSEWLGPLAPIALSPFFGLTMLSGAATYGPEWLGQRSSLLAESSHFNSPALFWTMLTLAITTSLPRLSKASKVVALACENLETYSAIIILIAIRMLGSSTSGAVDPTGTELAQAGLPVDVVVSIVVALNIIVVNGVKFCFELLVWLTPFPTVDAILEICNKTLCLALMGLYLLSPALATALSLLILIVSLALIGTLRRRTAYFREIVLGPLLAYLRPQWFAQQGDRFTAFTTCRTNGLPSFTRLAVTLTQQRGTIKARRWMQSVVIEFDSSSLQISNTLSGGRLMTIKTLDGEELQIAHRRWVEPDDCYQAPEPEQAPA